jgi:hypothetical protein
MAVMYGKFKKGEVRSLLKKEFDARDGKMSMAEIVEFLNNKGVRTIQGKEYNIASAGYLARAFGFRQRKKRKKIRVVNKKQKVKAEPAPKERTSFNKVSLAEMVLTHQLLPEGRKLDLLGEILRL